MKELSLNETRVIGCLIEKSITTPDQYPLSLNGLTNACNQKSNREPVLSLSETAVLDTLNPLLEAGLVAAVTGFGSRVTKYQHRFCSSEFSEYKLSSKEIALVCVLFLRGPQTAGELRTRSQRLYDFQSVQDVESTLANLMSQYDKPLVARMDREAGKRESRYVHLFSGEPDESVSYESAPATISAAGTGVGSRLEALESEISELKVVIQLMEERLTQLESR